MTDERDEQLDAFVRKLAQRRLEARRDVPSGGWVRVGAALPRNIEELRAIAARTRREQQ